MGDSSGGSQDILDPSVNFSIDGAQSLDLQMFLQSNECSFKCKTCNRTFATEKGLQTHLSHHKKLSEEINVRKSMRNKGYSQEKSLICKKSQKHDPPMNDLDQFINLINEENDKADLSFIDEVLTKNNNVTALCKVCGFSAKNDRGLKIHMNVHKTLCQTNNSTEKKKAPISNIKGRDNSINDKDENEVEKSFRCNLGNCSKLFASKNGLKIHVSRCHKEEEINFNEYDFAKLIQCYKSGVKVIRRIPRGARVTVAIKLTSLMNDCLTQNSTKAWQALFLFPYSILNVKRTNSKISLTKIIKENASKLTHDIKPEHRVKVSLKNIVESKVADGDIRGAIKILASADSIAEECDSTFEILQSKHPPPINSTEKPQSPKDMIPLAVSEKQVEKSISSFSSGSSSGIDGLSPQHLKDLLSLNSGEAASHLLTAITKVTNLMLSGKVCEEFVPYLYGAALVAFNKKDGGIRPIAIGGTLRRLVSKLCCAVAGEELVDQPKPKQLGFGVQGGAEAAVHAVRTFIKHNQSAEVIVKVDVSNAFNSLERIAFLKDVAEKLPSIYPFVYQCYSSPTNLFYNKSIILSSTGCQQGDPLGPVIFSLGINSIIQALTSDLNLWYLDDGTIGGLLETVAEDLSILKERFRLLGLYLNTAKCEAFIFPKVTQQRKTEIESKLNSIAPGISFIQESEFCLLGAPLMESSVEKSFQKKKETLEFFLEKLLELHPHVALYLLQHSLWIPRLTYLFRCAPLFKFKSFLTNMDENLRQALQSILNMKFTEQSWEQSSLPVKFGGIGIRSCEDLATPAFLSSTYSTKSLVGSILKSNDVEIVYVEDALMEWKLQSQSQVIPEHPSNQSCWDIPIITRKLEMIPNSSETSKARMLALSRQESGAWLHALPSKNLGTLLDNNTLRIAVALRTGGTICKPYKCVCDSTVKGNAIHGLSCNKSPGRYGLHSSLNAILKRALSSANHPSILEPVGLIREDGKRADGMTIFPWKRGRPLVWDATCVDTLAPSYLSQTSKKVAAAANKANNRKIGIYETIMLNHEFVPFAVETLGPYSDDTRRFVDELGKKLIEVSGDKRAKSFFIQRIGIEVQRGNAAKVLGTIPKGDSLNEIYYL